MKFSYANVMSTIAMFAAVTTGTSYAAASLAKDSVRTAQIKNGQVTLADLHPQVRAKLGKPATGGTTTKPPTGGALLPVGQWADTGTLYASLWAATSQIDQKVNLSSKIGTTGNVEFRLVGSITKPDNGKAAALTFYTLNAAGGQTGGQYAGLNSDVAGTFDAAAMGFGGAGSSVQPVIVAAKDAQTVYATHEGEGVTNTLRLQVRRVA